MNNVLSNTPTALIHLESIKKNLSLARSLKPDTKVLAVIKANAYGHGAIEVAQFLEAESNAGSVTADAFAVARVNEAMELRAAGVQSDIIILEGFLDQPERELCLQYRFLPVIHSAYQVALLADEPFWLKINTGMSRLGFNTEALKKCLPILAAKNLVGLVSHFANADVESHQSNQIQLDNFRHCQTLLADFQGLASMANSSAILNIVGSGFDWIRPGIMLYGSSGTNVPDHRLAAGMTLSAPVVAVNELKEGDAIGYGSTWQARSKCRVSVVGLGYADGYPREMPTGAPVIVNGKRRAIVGRISMDMSFVLLDGDDDVKPGDRVEFWGRQLAIDEVAAYGNTIAYTLMSGLTQRVKRIYSE